ncbi:MAG: histidine kinase [Betaproteobacteria bacterium]|nr:histidine kinase [Betaproteobacteria bacterium]
MWAQKKIVLVVDDNHDAADSLAILIRLRGHQSLVAYDTATGLKLAEETNPDVIIHDIGLPITDGYTAARQLRSNPNFKNTLLVALTAYSLTPDRKRAKLAGFDFHFAKPLDLDDLDAILYRRAG